MSLISVAQRHPVVFPLACAAAALLIVISEVSYQQSANRLQELSAMAQAHTDIRELHIALLGAEAGQRSYLLTGRKEYLQPYERGLASIDEALRSLDHHDNGDAQINALVTQMRALCDATRTELATAIRLHDAGQTDAAVAWVATEASRRRMDGVGALSAKLLARQATKADTARADLTDTLQRSRIGVGLLSVVGLLAMYLFLRQNLLLRRHQLELKRVVQADHDRLELEVAERTTRLTHLAQHLLTAREDERQRLARDLHDELGALLTSAKLDAARLRSRLAAELPDALDRLSDLVGKLNSGIALGRRIIEDLRPSTLSHLGLVSTLEIQAREFAERSGVVVHCALDTVSLTPAAELAVYRVVQEAITNITKYATANEVWIGLSQQDGTVQLSVRDDGVGFDAEAQSKSAYGLLGMRFRVQAEGGTLSVVSAPGAGTAIGVRLPAADIATG